MKYLVTCLAVMLLFFRAGMYAVETSGDGKILKLEAGAKGYYSSGVSESNFYYKPFSDLGLRFSMFEIHGAYARFMEYQITDGNGNFTNVDINQTFMSVRFSPLNLFDITGKYAYSFGEMKLEGHEYSGEVQLNLDKFSFSTMYEGKINSYVLNTRIKTFSHAVSLGVEYEFSKALSLDLVYEYSSIEFADLGYVYQKNTVRFGAVPEITESIFLMGGLSAGRDSDNYTILEADAGIRMKFFGMVKLTALYGIGCYLAPDFFSTFSDGSGGKGKIMPAGPSGHGSNTNPYLKSSKVGKTYLSHTLSFGASLYY